MSYNFSHIVYTHSDYDNVWEIWKHQIDKYLPNSSITVFTDSFTSDHTCNVVLYNDSLKYTDRVLSCLSKLPNEEEVVIYQHEDMFLYGNPDLDSISNFVDIVKREEADLIGLIRVVENLIPFANYNNLYENPLGFKYSTQPTIAKVKTLRKIFSALPQKGIWDFEKNCYTVCDSLRSYYCYANDSKRGLIHYDSSIYPYIATAVCKGEWNIQEYSKELNQIFYEMGY